MECEITKEMTMVLSMRNLQEIYSPVIVLRVVASKVICVVLWQCLVQSMLGWHLERLRRPILGVAVLFRQISKVYALSHEFKSAEKQYQRTVKEKWRKFKHYLITGAFVAIAFALSAAVLHTRFV